MNEIINNYLVTLSELIDTISKNEIGSMIDREEYDKDEDELDSLLSKDDGSEYREIVIKVINPDIFLIEQEDNYKKVTVEMIDRDEPTEQVSIKLYDRNYDIVLREFSIDRKDFLYEIKKQSLYYNGDYYVLDNEGNLSCSNEKLNEEFKKVSKETFSDVIKQQADSNENSPIGMLPEQFKAIMADEEIFKNQITSIFTEKDIEQIRINYEDAEGINPRKKQMTNLIN